MEPSPASREARATSWRVFVLVLFSAAYFYHASSHYEAARFDLIRAIAEHGEVWIDRFDGNTLDTVRIGGHTYARPAPGVSLLGVLPWWLIRECLSLLPVDDSKQLVLATYAMTILMSALPTALTSLLMLRFLARSGWRVSQACLLALGYGLGTIAFPFATLFFGHQLAACFAFGGFYLVWSSQQITGRARASRLLLAGLLIGFLPVIEHPGAIASGLIVLYAIALLGPWTSQFVVAGALLGFLPLPIYNEVAFGAPQTVSYALLAKPGTLLAKPDIALARPSPPPAGHSLGILGLSWPRLEALRYITFEPRRGLFYANPWLIFALAAPFCVRRIRGRGREFVLSAAIFAGFLVFNSAYGGSPGYWGGGSSFGPRYLSIAVPFVVLLVAFPMKSQVWSRVIGALMVVTILLMLPVAAIDPRLPYQARDPFFSFYLPLYARGLFSNHFWSIFPGGALFGSSGAFNLGRAASLPRDLEMLPLTLVWALGAMRLFKDQRGGMRTAQRVVAGLILALGLWPALPRIAHAGEARPGMCQATSANYLWPSFSSFALADEPAPAPLFSRAPGPMIGPARELKAAAQSAPRVAVTFSGQFEPGREGWYTMEMTVLGRAALYVDGLRRLSVRSPEAALRRDSTRVYFSSGPHEVIVRYMTDQPLRELYVTVGLGDAPQTLLQTGLWTRSCP